VHAGLFEGSIVQRLYGAAAAAHLMPDQPDTPHDSHAGICITKQTCTNNDECPTKGESCDHTKLGSCATDTCTPGATLTPGGCQSD
jgi:hypothetical protein